MRVVMPVLANLWCLVLVVLFVLVVGAMIVLDIRSRRSERRLNDHSRADYPNREIAATAPLEALAAIHARLQEIHRHLPPRSEDARWLASFTDHLRHVMNRAYARLEAAQEPLRADVLDQLTWEVEELANVVDMQLSARLADETDRHALETRLVALHASLRETEA
jgi:predicted transcriptional regulator